MSLETAPTQRSRGVLGKWSPIIFAVGSALKIQVHLRKVEQENKYMKKCEVFSCHNKPHQERPCSQPFTLIFSLDVLSMTTSALASVSKGFAESPLIDNLSSCVLSKMLCIHVKLDQVCQLITTALNSLSHGVGDGSVQGTEAFSQGVAFGASGVLTRPLESAWQYGLLGFAYGLCRAFIGFLVQPLSGLLDFGLLTVDGIGACFIRCLEMLNNKSVGQQIRNPHAIRADGVVREYSRWGAAGQVGILLARTSLENQLQSFLLKMTDVSSICSIWRLLCHTGTLHG